METIYENNTYRTGEEIRSIGVSGENSESLLDYPLREVEG